MYVSVCVVPFPIWFLLLTDLPNLLLKSIMRHTKTRILGCLEPYGKRKDAVSGKDALCTTSDTALTGVQH